jgi:hypothetical protein
VLHGGCHRSLWDPADAGGGDYLVISNVRNEKLFWDRREIAPYKPVIVIGLDDERNLFRQVSFIGRRSWQ